MFQFTYKETIRERVRAKCARHPRYNPERDGRSGIKGVCSTCYDLYDWFNARLKLDATVREFTRRCEPWARPRERHRAKPAAVAEAEQLEHES